MDTIWPIYIPSRGRATDQRTSALLSADGIEHAVVVEPRECAAYEAHLTGQAARVMTLPEDNSWGVCYARNGVYDLASAAGHSWLWILDDDIKTFMVREGTKMSKCPAATALREAQKIISQYARVGVAALEYQQFAWSSKKDAALNGYCDVAVALNLALLRKSGIRYDMALRMKEDRDIVLQALHKGLMSVRVQKYAFSAPKNGSNAGGCQDDYKSGIEAVESEKMVKKWGPGIASLRVKPDGRPDVSINWRMFAPRAAKHSK